MCKSKSYRLGRKPAKLGPAPASKGPMRTSLGCLMPQAACPKQKDSGASRETEAEETDGHWTEASGLKQSTEPGKSVLPRRSACMAILCSLRGRARETKMGSTRESGLSLADGLRRQLRPSIGRGMRHAEFFPRILVPLHVGFPIKFTGREFLACLCPVRSQLIPGLRSPFRRTLEWKRTLPRRGASSMAWRRRGGTRVSGLSNKPYEQREHRRRDSPHSLDSLDTKSAAPSHRWWQKSSQARCHKLLCCAGNAHYISLLPFLYSVPYCSKYL